MIPETFTADYTGEPGERARDTGEVDDARVRGVQCGDAGRMRLDLGDLEALQAP